MACSTFTACNIKYLLTYKKQIIMAKMNIERSIVIKAPAKEVFHVIHDFSQWHGWSPWLMMEPDAEVTVSADHKSHEWKGKRIGEGRMEIVQEETNRSVDYALSFVKPWKSRAKVRFLLSPEGDQTKVTWAMESRLPFFLFWMKKSMEAYLGMDYERGLRMLKTFVEQGETLSKLMFQGYSDFAGFKFLGIRTACDIKGMPQAMTKDFERLENYFADKHDQMAGDAFAQYHGWNLVKGRVEYTCGVSVYALSDELPERWVAGELPAAKVYTLRHQGPYEHLENAWSAIIAMQRSKELKPQKDYHPFELYINHPKHTAKKDLITDVTLAVR